MRCLQASLLPGSSDKGAAVLPGYNLSQCAQSWRDTDGYICEPDEAWEIRRSVILRAFMQNVEAQSSPGNGRTFFQQNWHPEMR